MKDTYLTDLFINEAKPALKRHSGGGDYSYDQYNTFWDAYQNNGTRTDYNRAFYGRGWNEVTYNPKYPIIAGSGNNSNSTFEFSKITDTKVPIDISKSTSGQLFQGASLLVTVRKLIVSEHSKYLNSFYGCSDLVYLTIEGVIGQNDFNVQWSTKLTHDSLMSIINALKDYSGDTSGTDWVVTLGSDNLAKLTQAEIKIAENKGWRLA